MKRKLLAVVCAATMVISTTMPAMAAGSSESISGEGDTFTGGSASIDVNSEVSKSDGTAETTKVYNVNVSWTMTPGAYSSTGDVYHWNPATLKYEKSATTTKDALTKTSDASVSITVTNNSNASVNYEITYAPATDGTNPISSETSSSGKTGTLASAEPTDLGLTGSPDAGAVGSAKSATYDATVGFDLSYAKAASANTAMQMGTYTVTVSK